MQNYLSDEEIFQELYDDVILSINMFVGQRYRQTVIDDLDLLVEFLLSAYINS